METDVPKYGWKVKLNHVFSQKRTQGYVPKLKQILPLLPLFFRYIIYSIAEYFKGKKPVMDFLFLFQSKQNSGVPLGGIGGGTIGRSFQGDYTYYQMQPGIYEYNKYAANQFIVTVRSNNTTIYQKVLCVNCKPKDGKLSSWDWNYSGENAEYIALYPRSWTIYQIPEINLVLTCRQISPVIPHNYKDSSIPCAVFEWIISNKSSEKYDVSITMTFQNRINTCGKVTSKIFNLHDRDTDSSIKGIQIFQSINGHPLNFNIATLKKHSNTIECCEYFNPTGDGSEIWNSLRNNGLVQPSAAQLKNNIGIAISCMEKDILSVQDKRIVFILSWDMPIVSFPLKRVNYKRYYTKYFGYDGKAGPTICLYSLINYNKWEKDIFKWQRKILENNFLPDWFKSSLLNELYYIVDGGTIWIDDDSKNYKGEDPRKTYGRFAYLEGHEYRMFNTYDVHFYASSALASMWPKLQLSLQYDMADAIKCEINSRFWYLYDGKCSKRKHKNSVPHDLGDPYEEPFKLINAYPIHDVSEWRDLNLKFILQVYRDYTYTNDLNYLSDMYKLCVIVMQQTLKWDKDGDGMIENSGSPDQTYDAWVMSGTSAYCGSLWLASLYSFIEIAKILKDFESEKTYQSVLLRAKKAFNTKLWNGKYYNFDDSNRYNSNSIMADQLCGIWFLRTCHSSSEVQLLEESRIKQALQIIYEFNVLKYLNGTQGAVNGMFPNGEIDTSSVQSEEVWTGVTYALASLMISEGMIENGFKTAQGIYTTVYEKSGLAFNTPEALHDTKYFRSLSYMRPLSIWSMYCTLSNFHQTSCSIDI